MCCKTGIGREREDLGEGRINIAWVDSPHGRQLRHRLEQNETCGPMSTGGLPACYRLMSAYVEEFGLAPGNDHRASAMPQAELGMA